MSVTDSFLKQCIHFLPFAFEKTDIFKCDDIEERNTERHKNRKTNNITERLKDRKA